MGAPADSASLGQPPPTMAVLQFEDRSESDEYLWLRGGLQDLFTQEIAATRQMQVVGTGEAQQVLAEQDLAGAGLTAAPRTPDAHQLAKANVILKGQYRVEGDRIRIDATLSDPVSDAPLSQAIVEGDVTDSCRLAGNLTAELMANWGQPLDATALARLRAMACPSFDLLLWLNEGELYVQAGDLPEAWYCFRRATKVEPDLWRPRNWLIQTLIALGQVDQANHELEQALPVVLAEARATYDDWEVGKLDWGEQHPRCYFSCERTVATLLRQAAIITPDDDLRPLCMGYCLLVGGVPPPHVRPGYWSRQPIQASRTQVDSALALATESLMAWVDRCRLELALKQEDLPAAISHWQAWDPRVDSVVSTTASSSITGEDLDRLLGATYSAADERQRLASWDADKVRQARQNDLWRVLALARRGGPEVCSKTFSTLGMPIVELTRQEQSVALPVGPALLVAPPGYGIEFVTGGDLVVDALSRRVDFRFMPMPPVEHAPPLRVSDDVSYRAALLQPALVVGVREGEFGEGTEANRTVTVSCQSLSRAGHLQIRPGSTHRTVYLGQHKIMVDRSAKRLDTTELTVIPGSYRTGVIGATKRPYVVHVESGRETWLDIPALLGSRYESPATTAHRSASRRQVSTSALPDLEIMPIEVPGRFRELRPLPSGLFVSLRKAGKEFVLNVSRDLVNWSDEVKLTEQLPISGSLSHVCLLEDRAGRFVLTWYGVGGGGLGSAERIWIATSSDLVNWRLVGDAPGFDPYKIAQAATGAYVIVYKGGWVTYSYDLIEWSRSRHLCSNPFGEASPWDGDSGDGTSTDKIHLVQDGEGVLHAFITDKHHVYHPDKETGSLTQHFLHLFVAHFSTTDGRNWSELDYLYSEKFRSPSGDGFPRAPVVGFNIARAPDGGLLGYLQTDRRTDPNDIVRTCPEAAGRWLAAYRDGEWWTTAERPTTRHRLPSVMLCLPARNETWMRLDDGFGKVTSRTLDAFTEPFHLRPATLEQPQWQEPESPAGSLIMLAQPRGATTSPLWAAVRMSLIYHFNLHDQVVLNAEVEPTAIEPTLASVAANTYYSSHDFVLFPQFQVRGNRATLRADIVAPRRNRTLDAVTCECTLDELPAQLQSWSGQILSVLGVTAGPAPASEQASLFRDVQSMQFVAQALGQYPGSERQQICRAWYDHDPDCPFPWQDVANWLLRGSPSPEEEARRGMVHIIDRSQLKPEIQQEIAQLQRRAALFEFIPPYNSFIYRDGYYYLLRPVGVPVEPTSAQMLEALRRCPYAQDIRTFLIVTTGKAGLWQTADSLLRGAEEAEPDEWQWKKLRGLLLGWQGRYDEAAVHWATCPQTQRDGKPVYVTFYDDVNRGSPRNPSGWKRSGMPVEAMRGYDLTRAGRYAHAADVLEPAVRKYGRKVSPGLDMMVCAAMHSMCQSGQPERAIAVYPHDVPVAQQTEYRRYHLARAYFLAGNRANARRILHDVQSLGNRFYGRSKTSFLPPHMEIDRFRRQLQHHRSLFGL